MKRFFLIALAVVAVVAVTVVAWQIRAPEAPAVAYAAKTFSDGEAVSLTSLKGKPAILSSWATWCAECKHELPSLEALWQSRQADGLQIVAVNIDVEATNPGINTMISDLGLTMPIWHDGDNDFSLKFNAPGVPTSILFDANGQVVKTWIGRTDFQDSEVTAAIDALLGT